jgi:diguanylate cyclase (GGDEF)-like protein
MKVLIAEDDAVSQRILRRAVERLGHQCVPAADGAEAWELFQRNPADVVISDWMMPGLDGPELCSRVRGHANGPYTHFILLSALSDRQHFLSGMRAGADDYLTKPLDFAELQVRLSVAERITSLHAQLAQKNEQLELLNRALHDTARTDPLTGLGNRLRLREDLVALQDRAQRYQHTYSLAMLDVDHFKAYNDRYGHLRGDEALRTVAETIRTEIRAGDSAYRYGGEEFLVILAGQDQAGAICASDRLRKALLDRDVPHAGNTGVGRLSVSVGVCGLVQGNAADWEAALAAADAALYRAKTSGRNRVEAAPLAAPASAATTLAAAS